MPKHKTSRTSIGLLPRLRSAWRRERLQRPAFARLALIGAAALGLSAALAATRLSLIAQLVGGLALLPLSLAAFVRLLPPLPWTDGGAGGWGHGRGGDSDGPWSPDDPALFDWDSLERQFRAYAEEQASLVVQ